MGRKQSKAKCAFCGEEYAKAGMTKHLAGCAKRRESNEKAAQGKNGSVPLYHLRVQDSGPGMYWLDLEMPDSITLKDIDFYLRAIWLECCGHLSRFSLENWGAEIPMNRKVKDVFPKESQIFHIYDFGTSSETLIKFIDARTGPPLTKYKIFLMARNSMPEEQCIECGKPASWFCEECLIEDDVWGALCDEHRETHPHENYGEPTPIFNSPRMGICGYNGPAKPPY